MIEKCPRCGSNAGYQYVIIVSYLQWVEWDGTPVAAENRGVGDKMGKIGECVDCHHRFNMAKNNLNGAG